VRPELLVLNPLQIDYNQQNIVINFHQDFMTSMYSGFFQGQMDRGLFYWPNHFRETWLGCPSKKKKKTLQTWDHIHNT
jgi:hypothetical protein